MDYLINEHLMRSIGNFVKYGKKYEVDKEDVPNSLVRIKESLINEKQEDIFDACTFTFFNTLSFSYSELNQKCFEFISAHILSSYSLDDACFFAEQFLLRVGMLLNFFAGEGLDAKEAATKKKNKNAITTLLTKDMSNIFDYIIKCIDTDTNSKSYLELFEFVQIYYSREKLSFIENNGYNYISSFFNEINKRISDVRECKKPYYKNFCNKDFMINKTSNI